MKKLTDIQAIAFDLDGTLVDSVPGLAEAARLTLADLHLGTVTDDQVKVWVGNGIDKLVERALFAVNAPMTLKDQAKQRYTQHYDQTMEAGTQLFAGVKSTLHALVDAGYPLALVTNKPAKFLPDLLTNLGIKDYFSLCLGDGDVIKLKPHPAPLYQVMATFGLFNDQVLFVGDSRNDILAAKHAGCPTVALSYGYNYGEPISTSSPDMICDDFSQLLDYIAIPKQPAAK